MTQLLCVLLAGVHRLEQDVVPVFLQRVVLSLNLKPKKSSSKDCFTSGSYHHKFSLKVLEWVNCEKTLNHEILEKCVLYLCTMCLLVKIPNNRFAVKPLLISLSSNGQQL